MEESTVICVLKVGGIYGSDYVYRLQRMCERWLPSMSRFVCLTDRAVPCDSIPMQKAYPGKWSKIELFDPRLPLTGRILYLDLDVVVTGSLQPFVEHPADFAIAASGPQKWHPKRVPGYNSSVMVWDAGARPEIFQRFTMDRAQGFVGDQDWIGYVCPGESTFDAGLVAKRRPGVDHDEPLLLCINPKNHELTHDPIIRDNWLHV